MIKTVIYFEYHVLKAIGKKVRILKADDNSATIVTGTGDDSAIIVIDKQQS